MWYRKDISWLLWQKSWKDKHYVSETSFSLKSLEMNPCIDALYTSHCPVLLEKILSSLSEFLSHLYSVTPLYLEFHYFNSPFKQKFNCKYIFQMHLVDLSKTHEQLVLSVSYTLMIKPANQS